MAGKKSKPKSAKTKKAKAKSGGGLGDLLKLFQKKNSQWIDNMSEASIYVFAQYGPSCTEESYTPSGCCVSNTGDCIPQNLCM